jgi:hypothetical protein
MLSSKPRPATTPIYSHEPKLAVGKKDTDCGRIEHLSVHRIPHTGHVRCVSNSYIQHLKNWLLRVVRDLVHRTRTSDIYTGHVKCIHRFHAKKTSSMCALSGVVSSARSDVCGVYRLYIYPIWCHTSSTH